MNKRIPLIEAASSLAGYASVITEFVKDAPILEKYAAGMLDRIRRYEEAANEYFQEMASRPTDEVTK
jgi:hypothetical protein